MSVPLLYAGRAKSYYRSGGGSPPPPPPPSSSALADMAASMSSGQWAQMTPTPSGLSLFVGGTSSGIKTGYASKLAYDPVGKRIYGFGGDHADANTLNHWQYDEATNAWTLLGTPSWAGGVEYHGWERYCWDTANSRLWAHKWLGYDLYRWEGGANSSNWTAFSLSSHFSYADSIPAICWFPDRSELVVYRQENGTNGRVITWNPTTQAGTIHSSTLSPTSGTSSFAQYSPQHGVVWMGGGDTSTWILQADGTVLSRAAAPYALGVSNDQGLMVCNPVNGNWITMFGPSNWHDFNPITNTWTARGGSCVVLEPPNASGTWLTFGVVAVPIPAYGVIVFIKAYSLSSPAEMWLFKP